jgi:hypothetical protein
MYWDGNRRYRWYYSRWSEAWADKLGGVERGEFEKIRRCRLTGQEPEITGRNPVASTTGQAV